ncbi:LysE family translocator [Aureibacillus halotolerans]|uniref:Threonine/homoserine/homoserine lactone efflux protein n=1 Tax=Aureibacillus halotolerans TaxID=1508390 RepID=A0A4R6UC31_9BACI|nr:LysE family translocator [Aureibacillus halotolerans]TDQ42633.1 threonine/homoserine/homoserine lactone efflux protein [Aureibacillus halotolerans]
MDVPVVLSFLGVAILVTLAPGPDNLFVLAQSMTYGKRAGFATSLGLCTGLLGHTAAAALGISAIVYQSAFAFQVVKWAGALYLLYLAWRAFAERHEEQGADKLKNQSSYALYRKGIVMNVLNPKVSLYFLALLPQFVSVEQGSVPLQMMVLGGLFILQAIVVFTVLSMFAGTLGTTLQRHPRIVHAMQLTKAGLFVILGVRMAFLTK